MDKKKSAVSSKNNKGKKKKGMSIKTKKRLLNAFLCFVILVSVGVIALTISIMKTRANDDAILDLNNLELKLTTILYYTDSKTGEVKELDRLYGSENRVWVSIDDIPKHVSDAFISIEDKRYYSHNGVDIIRTIGSAVNVFIPIYSQQSGGSTITQQLVKNLTDDWDKTWYRKITEIVRAYDLDRKFTKEQVLEAYLNTINLAAGNQGIKAASNYFFGKEPNQLSIAEGASLAAITKNPTRFNPYTKPEDNKSRQLLVLGEMLEQGLITQEDYDLAKDEKLNLNSKAIENANKSKSWFVDMVVDQVVNDLMVEKKITKQEANNMIYNGGLRIYTTINTDVQAAMDAGYAKAGSIFPKQRGDIQPESGMVILDPNNGEIRGVVGGITKSGNRVLNRAVSAIRQPGSTMKPLGTYTPAIDRNMITMSSIVPDAPVKEVDGKPWPVNYYSGYYGNMTAVEALSRSVNTIPSKLVTDLGFDISADYLKNKFKISTVQTETKDGKNDLNASALALGGMTQGVTPLELAAAYQVFANGGVYYQPHSYTKITNAVGENIIDKKIDGERVLTDQTAYVVNRMLTQVVNGPNGTGRSTRFGNMPLIGKTGTTSDNKDLWYVGSSAYYVGVTYWGFDEPKEMTYGVNSHPSMLMWKTVMQAAHAGLSPKEFPISNDVVVANYCSQTGQIATPNCPTPIPGYYKSDNVPSACTLHGGDQTSHVENGNKEDNDDNKNSGSNSSNDENVMYTLSFDPDGGSSVISISVKPNEYINVDGQKTTKAGYVFDGWYYGDKKVSGIFKMTEKDIRLKAKWIKKE